MSAKKQLIERSLVDEFIRLKLSKKKIMQKYGISRHKIYVAEKEYNVRFEGNDAQLAKEKHAKILKLYDEGYSRKQIESMTKASRSVVAHVLRNSLEPKPDRFTIISMRWV